MSKQDYIPPGVQTFMVWHDQLSNTVSGSTPVMGIVPADVTLLASDNADYHAKVTAQTAAANASKQATADLAASRATAEKHARALANRLKAHPDYTVAMGRLFGIEGPEDSTDLATMAPKLTGKDKRGGVVEVSFNVAKSGGINLYSRRDGETEFKFLARDSASPYVDNRPMLVAGKPELRNYKAIYVVGDDEVSQFSDEITVNCAPLV